MVQVYTAIARNPLKHDAWGTYALLDDPTRLEAALMRPVSHVVVTGGSRGRAAITTLSVSGVELKKTLDMAARAVR